MKKVGGVVGLLTVVALTGCVGPTNYMTPYRDEVVNQAPRALYERSVKNEPCSTGMRVVGRYDAVDDSFEIEFRIFGTTAGSEVQLGFVKASKAEDQATRITAFSMTPKSMITDAHVVEKEYRRMVSGKCE